MPEQKTKINISAWSQFFAKLEKIKELNEKNHQLKKQSKWPENKRGNYETNEDQK